MGCLLAIAKNSESVVRETPDANQLQTTAKYWLHPSPYGVAFMVTPNSVTRTISETTLDQYDLETMDSESPATKPRDLQSGSSAKQSTVRNVGSNERNISLAAGALLLLTGLPKLMRGRGILQTAAGAGLVYRGMTGNCPLYQHLGLSTRDAQHDRQSSGKRASGSSKGVYPDGNERDTPSSKPSAAPSEYNLRGIHVEQSVTISKPASDCYAFWRELGLLPQFMHHLKSVVETDQTHSHWVASAPLGFSVEWDAEIINDEKDRLIAWRSVGNAGVDNSGSVRFIDVPGREDSTEVRVVLDYIPPAGKLGSIVASLFGEEPNQTVKADLKRFQQLMETGEVATNGDGKPRAK